MNTKIPKMTSAQLLDKRKEVVALWKIGTRVMEIVAATGLSWPAVNKAINLFQDGGMEALQPMIGRTKGSGRIIPAEQEDRIRQILYTQHPRDVGIRYLDGLYYTAPTDEELTEEMLFSKDIILNGNFPQYLWCRDSVRELIFQITGKELSTQLINRYLCRWGFPTTKQNQRPMARCTQAIQDWLRKYPPDISTYWLYGQRLNTKVKQSKISATDHHRKELWSVIQGNFSEEKQIVFLSQLMKQTGEPLTVIRYDYYHFTKEKVSRWLAKKNITLLPLLQDNERKRLENDQKRQLAVRDELQKEALATLGITVTTHPMDTDLDHPKKPVKPVKPDF